MRVQDIIAAKRDGRELAGEDISRIVLDYSSDLIPDYQMSAFLMAALIRGLSFNETLAMTRAMIDSGITLDLTSIPGKKVDKHSTGGVGDKTTLVIAPALAALGLKVPKMSGRGLGFTGGTLDKLDSIPGFTTALSVEGFIQQVREIGVAIVGQNENIVPADKKIYVLRDVTATVESIPLVAASVMSKKIACGADAILLDVKVGSGAFMREMEQARELAEMMKAIGEEFGRTTGAVITDMNQPLGCAVGNALEVAEAIETLKGRGPADSRALCVELTAIMLCMTEQTSSVEEGRALAVSVLDSGAALAKFAELLTAQGGDVRVIDDPMLLPQARVVQPVRSRESGFVELIDCTRIGVAASILGAGRERKEDTIDPAVGLAIEKKLGDRVEKGETLAVLFANDADSVPAAESAVLESYTIGEKRATPPLIHETIL